MHGEDAVPPSDLAVYAAALARRRDESVGRMVTLRDVATAAGVSYQAVSRALNDSSRVRPATLAQVRAAVDSLGYRPNAAARRLKSGRSRVLGVVTTDLTTSGATRILQSVVAAATERGWSTLITHLDPHHKPPDFMDTLGRSLAPFHEHGVRLVVLVDSPTRIASAVAASSPRFAVLNIRSHRQGA